MNGALSISSLIKFTKDKTIQLLNLIKEDRFDYLKLLRKQNRSLSTPNHFHVFQK